MSGCASAFLRRISFPLRLRCSTHRFCAGLTKSCDVYAYSLSDRTDDFTEEMRGGSVHYNVLANLSIEEQAQAIRTDEVDVLIDLGGHTEGGMTLMILARRPAPVQLSAIGWFATTGVSLSMGF